MITTARWGLILLIAAVGLGGCVGASQRPAPEMKPAPVSDRGLSAERSARASGRAATRKPRELTIQLESQSFLYREHGEVVHSGPISSGRAGYPTPLGHFAVLSKQADKVSYRYTNQLGMRPGCPIRSSSTGIIFYTRVGCPAIQTRTAACGSASATRAFSSSACRSAIASRSSTEA